MTASVSIPTAARPAVRALIKGHAGFKAWCVLRGLDSRSVLNAQLLKFAEEHGMMNDVLALVGTPQPAITRAPKTAKPVHSGDADKEYFEAMAHEKAKEDAALQAEIAEIAEAVRPVIAHKLPVGEASQAVFVTNDILSGVDQFLSPLVKAEIVKALQPVVEAANKPAVTVEVERVVEVAATPQAPTGELPFARQASKVALGKLLGSKERKGALAREVTLWDAHGAAPSLDPFYVIDIPNMAMMATAFERGTNVWLVGPRGSGKTSMPIQYAALTGRPLVKIGFTRRTEEGELVGGQSLKDGNTSFEFGALLAAMQRPGTVIVLDELTLSPAGAQGIVQGTADDHRSYTIHGTGQVVKAAPGVVFCVCDNTAGYGDESGQYHGTNPSNAALVDRFGRMVKIDYMPAAQEVAALVNHTGAPQDACLLVVEFANKTRAMPEVRDFAPSLRQMKALVQTVQDGFTAKQALAVTILNKLPQTERAAIEAVATLQWAKELEDKVHAKTYQHQPSGSDASVAFDDEVSAELRR